MYGNRFQSQIAESTVNDISNDNLLAKERCKQKPIANTKVTKNILNQIQTNIQCCKNDNLDKCQGDSVDQKAKFEATLKNLRDHLKCNPSSTKAFHFKLHIPSRLNKFYVAHKRNSELQFKQNELQGKKEQGTVCNLAASKSRNWKEMKKCKDNIVFHLETALAALEEGGEAPTLERYFPTKSKKFIERKLSPNTKNFENETVTATQFLEDKCIKQIGSNSLNITPCCKGCYSISCTVPSQFNYSHLHSEETLFRDHSSAKRDHEKLSYSYLNEEQKIRDSILSKNIACLSKHYAAHLQHVTTTEDCLHSKSTDNTKGSTLTISSPYTSTSSTLWKSNTFHTASSTDTKSSFQNLMGNTISLCTDERHISNDCDTESRKEKVSNIQIICDKDRETINLINNGRYKEQNYAKHKKSRYLENETGMKKKSGEFDGERESKFVSLKNLMNKISLGAKKDVFPNQESYENYKGKKEKTRNSTPQYSRQQRNTRLSSLDKINVEISNLKQELEDMV